MRAKIGVSFGRKKVQKCILRCGLHGNTHAGLEFSLFLSREEDVRRGRSDRPNDQEHGDHDHPPQPDVPRLLSGEFLDLVLFLVAAENDAAAAKPAPVRFEGGAARPHRVSREAVVVGRDRIVSSLPSSILVGALVTVGVAVHHPSGRVLAVVGVVPSTAVLGLSGLSEKGAHFKLLLWHDSSR